MAAMVVHLVMVATMPGVGRVVDPFLLMIVFYASRGDVVTGMLVGAGVGLVEDAVSGGLYGLHGFAGTCVGYGLARAAQFLTLQKAYYVVLFFGAGVLVQQAVMRGLTAVLLRQQEVPALGELTLMVVVMGLLGLTAVVTIESVADRWGSWRRDHRPRISLD